MATIIKYLNVYNESSNIKTLYHLALATFPQNIRSYKHLQVQTVNLDVLKNQNLEKELVI